jgi:hypothetical protein
MKEMFEASVDGKPYDPDRWSQYFRPAGVSAPAGGSTAAAAPVEAAEAAVARPAAVATSSFDEDDTPTATAPVVKPAAGGQNAQDILAMIRARQAKT